MSFRIRIVGICCGSGEKTCITMHGELCISHKFSPHSKLNPALVRSK